MRRILKGATWLCKLFALTKYYIIGRKPLNPQWPDASNLEKEKSTLNETEQKQVMTILSKHVSHCLEELKVGEIFDGVRDISMIKRKMSKSHFRALEAVLNAGLELNFQDQKIKNVFQIYREIVWTYNLRSKVKEPRLTKEDLLSFVR